MILLTIKNIFYQRYIQQKQIITDEIYMKDQHLKKRQLKYLKKNIKDIKRKINDFENVKKRKRKTRQEVISSLRFEVYKDRMSKRVKFFY